MNKIIQKQPSFLYHEVWYLKRTCNSEPEERILFFDNTDGCGKMRANSVFYRAKEANDARILFGSDVPKEIASSWQ